jgi:hypothetical protein
MANKIVIGWKKKIDLPEWGIYGLRAKVDTGAKTSSLHVEDIEVLPHGRVRFYVVVQKKEPRKRVEVVTRVLRIARIRTNTESVATRIFVATRIHVGSVEDTIELNLEDRGNFIYRMLLGRTALTGRFVVDVSKSK